MSLNQVDLRVIFVGPSQAGKTTLMNRYIDGEFTQTTQSTINPIFTPKTVTSESGKDIVMQLWDTAGQERYQDLSQVFYRGTHVAVICYDSSEKESHEKVSVWKERVLSHEPNAAIILVGTKLDLTEDKEKAYDNLINAAKENNIETYFLTSALNGEGVEDLFTNIATVGEEILSKCEPPPPPSQNLASKPAVENPQNCSC